MFSEFPEYPGSVVFEFKIIFCRRGEFVSGANCCIGKAQEKRRKGRLDLHIE